MIDFLSVQERIAFKHFLEGMNIKEISRAMNLSYVTIYAYRKKIFEKYEVKDIRQLFAKVNQIDPVFMLSAMKEMPVCIPISVKKRSPPVSGRYIIISKYNLIDVCYWSDDRFYKDKFYKTPPRYVVAFWMEVVENAFVFDRAALEKLWKAAVTEGKRSDFYDGEPLSLREYLESIE